MRIYIAASFDRQEEMRLLAAQIESWTKHTITSRWHGRVGGPAGFEPNYPNAGQTDVDDIKAADVLLSIGGKSTSGGRFVEFGMAWAWNMPIVHLGESENVFFNLPGVTLVPNRGALMDVLREKFVGEAPLLEDEVA